MGAYGALQDWDGFYRFAWGQFWSHVTENKAVIGFDMAKDPLAWLSDRIAMVLFLRGDASASREKFAYGLSPNHLETDQPLGYPGVMRRLGLIAQTGSTVTCVPTGVQRLSPEQMTDLNKFPDLAVRRLWAYACDPKTKLARSTTGEITIDGRKNTFAVVTPRTESLSVGSGSLQGNFLSIDKADGFTTVATISLDGKPLPESRSILLLHLTDTVVEGNTFNNTRTMHKAGAEGPLLYRRGHCRVILATPETFRVTPLTVDGETLATLPGIMYDGRFTIDADTGCRNGGVFAYHLTR